MILTFWCSHTDRSRVLAGIVLEAIHACGWKQEYAAARLGISPAQFSRQLAGVESLSLWRLAELPDEFHREYDRRRAALRGAVVLEAPDLSLIRGACALGEKRMSKMFDAGAAPAERKPA